MASIVSDVRVGPDAVVRGDVVLPYLYFPSGPRVLWESHKDLLLYCFLYGVFFRRTNDCIHNIDLDFEVVVRDKVGGEKCIDCCCIMAGPRNIRNIHTLLHHYIVAHPLVTACETFEPQLFAWRGAKHLIHVKKFKEEIKIWPLIFPITFLTRNKTDRSDINRSSWFADSLFHEDQSEVPLQLTEVDSFDSDRYLEILYLILRVWIILNL